MSFVSLGGHGGDVSLQVKDYDVYEGTFLLNGWIVEDENATVDGICIGDKEEKVRSKYKYEDVDDDEISIYFDKNGKEIDGFIIEEENGKTVDWDTYRDSYTLTFFIRKGKVVEIMFSSND